MPLTRLTAIADLLCQLIARHGHLRRLPGPLVVVARHPIPDNLPPDSGTTRDHPQPSESTLIGLLWGL
jgi:hypothetical protein